MDIPEDKDPKSSHAKAWFERLAPMPQAFALAEIERAPQVMMVAGLTTRGITRDEAKALIMSGPVKRAPKNQSGDAAYCGIVVIDPASGFPVQLQTLPL